MTLPNERYRAIKYTEQFLTDLLDPKKTPRVPKHIRQRAYSCLRHYPSRYEMDVVATRSPSVFETSTPIDAVSQMIFDYEAKK